MTFNAKQARKHVKEAKLRKERERLAKQKEDNKRFEAQLLRAKEDLPKRMEELFGWIQEQADKERVEGTFSGWSQYGEQDAYYRELVTIVVQELIFQGFAARDEFVQHEQFRPADDCPMQDVWTYPIHINWADNR